MPWPDKEMNTKHRLDPQVGDYWNEMFCPIMVVVAVHPDRVVICRKIKSTDKDHWTWDLTKLDTVTREAFAEIPLYKSPKLDAEEATHCDVVPEVHSWVHDWAIKALFGDAGVP
jgi:hypothetical protein